MHWGLRRSVSRRFSSTLPPSCKGWPPASTPRLQLHRGMVIGAAVEAEAAPSFVIGEPGIDLVGWLGVAEPGYLAGQRLSPLIDRASWHDPVTELAGHFCDDVEVRVVMQDNEPVFLASRGD